MIDKETFVLGLKETLLEIIQVFKSLFPKSKVEIILFLFLFVFYASFGYMISSETCIQDCLIKRYDVYMSFDVGMRFHGVPFGADIAHPLFNLYSTPISLLLEFFGDLYHNHKIKTIGFATICNMMVVLSVVYVYRYLFEIAKVKNKIVLFLFVFFYSFSFTCLMLSFTIETYSFSIFVLSYFVYYYSKKIHKGEQLKASVNFLFCFVIGGITVTNTVKGMIPMFFSGIKFTKALKQVIIIGLILSMVFFAAIYHSDLYEFFMIRFTQALPEANVKVSFLRGWEFLVGGSMLFPDVSIVSAIIQREFAPEYKDYFMYQIDAVGFSYIWEHIYTLLLSVLLFVPLFTDFKNKLVQLLFLLFAVDLIVHLVVQFGMHEGYIYGGHWVYVIPLLFGWGYQSLKSWKRSAYVSTVACLFICMLVNNYVRLFDFIELSRIVWPSEAYKW